MSNEKYLGIDIDISKDRELSEQAQQLLTNYYCLENEPSPQYAFARASVAYSFGDINLAQRIYDAASKGWFMFASPVLSNAPLPGAKVKSLPISCFLSYVPDSLEGLIEHSSELRWLSVKGGGVGGHWSSVRAVSDKAPGPIPFMHTVDADMVAYRQGKTRKGSYAAYMDISHPDIVEFVGIRVPTGDVNRKCLNLHHAVNLTDDFMQAVANDEDWKLIDPDDKTVRDTIKARKLWETILETRYRTGEPYLNFIDTVNRALPKSQKELGLRIKGSNLCNEIHLVTDEKRTAVSYLQKHNVPFESQRAEEINEEIFKRIKEQAVEETLILGREKGEAPDMAGTGRRNAHLLAIAPNANSSLILNTSPSIEPWKANAFTSRTRVGSHLTKNKYLERELAKIGKNTEEVWSDIITNGGSVQQLDFLNDEIKYVFKTAIEMDQDWVVYLGGQRQKHLCQGQSLNIFFPAGASRGYIHKVHFNAWKYGCKGLYYLRTETSNRAENISKKVEKNRLVEFSELKQSESECVACEG